LLINVRIQHPADIQIKAWGLLTLIKQAGFLELTGPGISGNKRLLFSPRITGADRGSLCDLSKGFCWGGLLLRILTLPEFSDDDAVTAAGSAGAATDPAGSRR
jgi:hypothetical protein